jgi:hypothetical protein
MMAKVRKRLAASEQTTQNVKKLNYVDSKEQYRVEISNRFAALENSD